MPSPSPSTSGCFLCMSSRTFSVDYFSPSCCDGSVIFLKCDALRLIMCPGLTAVIIVPFICVTLYGLLSYRALTVCFFVAVELTRHLQLQTLMTAHDWSCRHFV